MNCFGVTQLERTKGAKDEDKHDRRAQSEPGSGVGGVRGLDRGPGVGGPGSVVRCPGSGIRWVRGSGVMGFGESGRAA